MLRLKIVVVVALALGLSAHAGAQPAAPPADDGRIFRLDGDGPLGRVLGMAFGADGNTLYETGWDKFVRVWERKADGFVLSKTSLRTPIGPGSLGVLNTLAVSADRRWLAVGGNAVSAEAAGFRQFGLVVPQATADRLAQGIIYVFDLREPDLNLKARRLEGHRGQVIGLTFVDTPAGQPAKLVSAGLDFAANQPSDRPRLTLRLWDVAAKSQLHLVDAGEKPTTPLFRSFLAAWTLPPVHDRVRLAVASQEMGLRAWDFGVGPVKVEKSAQLPNRVLSYWNNGGVGELLTGQLGKKAGNSLGILVSRDAASVDLKPNGERLKQLAWDATPPIPPTAVIEPVAQVVVASRQLLAVVTAAQTPPQFRLQLLDLASKPFGKLLQEARLWDGAGSLPIITSSADGSRLAVVGNPAGEILLYETAELLKNPAVQPQRLRCSGERFAKVYFVKKGADRGLWFQRTDSALVLDIAKRRFVAPAGWILDVSDEKTWRSELSEGPSLTVFENGRPLKNIPIIAEEPSHRLSKPQLVSITTHAVGPPVPPLTDPVVAVAQNEEDVGPTLWLYNGRTGEKFRKLSGHTGIIRGLSFAADGKSLVSIAEDLTTCVWSLLDLNRIVHARGALPEVILSKDQNKRVVVAHGFDPLGGEPRLQTGDLIEKIVEDGGRETEVASPMDVIYAAAARKPDQSLTLRTNRGVITTKLVQLVDERKPLFTFYLKTAGSEPEWLAWTPFGAYDSEGANVESLFGWHFNQLANPAQPAVFALATQYKKFRRPDLMHKLMENLPIEESDAQPMIRDPKMRLAVDVEGENNAQESVFLMRRAPTKLSLSLLDEPAPRDWIASVQWRLDGGPAQPMGVDGPFWEADLAGTAWDLKPHKFSVELRTKESADRPFTKDFLVRRIPRRPRLTARTPENPAWGRLEALQVKEARFRIAADVDAEEGMPVQVELVQSLDGKEVHRETFGPKFVGKPGVDTTIELKPGANSIELNASNVGETDGDEVVRLDPLTVRFSPEPVAIRLDALVLLPDTLGAAPRTLTIGKTNDLGDVHDTRVRLEGEIQEKPITAVWRLKDGGDWKPLTQFQRGVAVFTFRQMIDLPPGRQTILIRAAGANETPATTRELHVNCLPTVARPQNLVVEAIDPLNAPGEVPTRVQLSAQIVGDPARHPVDTVVVLVDDEKTSADALKIDKTTGVVSARVNLRTGLNHVRVRLGNKWSESEDSNTVELTFVRPPLLKNVRVDRPGNGREATMRAQITSMTPYRRVEIVHEASSVTPDPSRVKFLKLPVGVSEIQEVVTLEPGKNTFRLHALNDDGAAEFVTPAISYEAPGKPPVITPPQDGVATGRRYTLRFHVASESRLERVELVGPKDSDMKRIDVSRQTQREGEFQLDVVEELKLLPSVNTYKITAFNAVGPSMQTCRLGYTPKPAIVKIDSIKSKDGQNLWDKNQLKPAQVPDGRVRLHGWIVWPDKESMEEASSPHGEQVRVWLNGFPQVSSNLRAPGAGTSRREFQTDIVLNQPTKNEIVVKLRDVPLEIEGEPRLMVDCRKPEQKVRLHLWVIGVGLPRNADYAVEARKLRDSAVKALNGTLTVKADSDSVFGGRCEFSTPAFPNAILWGPNCTPRSLELSISTTMMHIHKEIPLRDTPSNEVVMIYYQGGELIRDDHDQLQLRLGTGNNTKRFPLTAISDVLASTRGAKLLMLDVNHVDRAVKLTDAPWLDDDLKNSVGLLQVSWPPAPAPDTNLSGMVHAALLNHRMTLGDVTQNLAEQTKSRAGRFPGLQFLDKLNPSLEQLNIGGIP